MQRLALDLGIGDLSVVGEAAQEMMLAAVEIGSSLMAAIEDHRVAASRIAHRHGEKRPRQVVRQPDIGGVGDVERVGLPLEPFGKQRVIGGESIGLIGVPSGAGAPVVDAVLLAK